MSENIPQSVGSYIVRDKKGTYMSAYSAKLGDKQARLWAEDCAKRSRGVLYFRPNEGEAEEELKSYLPIPKNTSKLDK